MKKTPVDIQHSAEIAALHQYSAISVRELKTKFPQYSRSTIYRHAKAELGKDLTVDRRKMNKGRPRKLSEEDCNKAIESLESLRNSYKPFASPRIAVKCDIDTGKISNRTVRRALNRRGYGYLSTWLKEKTNKRKRLQSASVYNCNICSKSCASLHALDLHKRKHPGENQILCYYCKNYVSAKKSLKVHMRQHTGEQPFQCNECERKFFDRSYLQNNLQKHSNEKPNFDALQRHSKTRSIRMPSTCHVWQTFDRACGLEKRDKSDTVLNATSPRRVRETRTGKNTINTLSQNDDRLNSRKRRPSRPVKVKNISLKHHRSPNKVESASNKTFLSNVFKQAVIKNERKPSAKKSAQQYICTDCSEKFDHFHELEAHQGAHQQIYDIVVKRALVFIEKS